LTHIFSGCALHFQQLNLPSSPAEPSIVIPAKAEIPEQFSLLAHSLDACVRGHDGCKAANRRSFECLFLAFD